MRLCRRKVAGGLKVIEGFLHLIADQRRKRRFGGRLGRWRGRNELIAAGNGALFVDNVDGGVVEQFVLEGTPQTLALSPDLKVVANGLADGSINFRNLNSRKR